MCAYIGIPISVSHSLIGGLMGPSLIAGVTKEIITSGLIKILVFIVLAPVIGITLGYLLMITTINLNIN
jgi:PiT family inorganic phosphate transporter